MRLEPPSSPIWAMTADSLEPTFRSTKESLQRAKLPRPPGLLSRRTVGRGQRMASSTIQTGNRGLVLGLKEDVHLEVLLLITV
jgi:hypothetical protein